MRLDFLYFEFFDLNYLNNSTLEKQKTKFWVFSFIYLNFKNTLIFSLLNCNNLLSFLFYLWHSAWILLCSVKKYFFNTKGKNVVVKFTTSKVVKKYSEIKRRYIDLRWIIVTNGSEGEAHEPHTIWKKIKYTIYNTNV